MFVCVPLDSVLDGLLRASPSNQILRGVDPCRTGFARNLVPGEITGVPAAGGSDGAATRAGAAAKKARNARLQVAWWLSYAQSRYAPGYARTIDIRRRRARRALRVTTARALDQPENTSTNSQSMLPSAVVWKISCTAGQ